MIQKDYSEQLEFLNSEPYYASSAGLSPRVAPCQNLRGGPP